MDLSVSIVISPSETPEMQDVLIKVFDHKPVVLGEGYIALDQEITTPDANKFGSLQSYILAALANLSHEIANDIEEAGYTTIADLMLKLSEHH